MRYLSTFFLVFNFLFLVSQNDSSFSKFYTRIAFSYSLGTNQTQYLFDPLNSPEFNQNSYSNPIFGSGVSYIGGLGFRLTKNIAIESNINYLKGNEVQLYSYQSASKLVQARMTDNCQFLFQPSLVLSADFKKFHPYIKVGMVIPFYNQSTFFYTIQSLTDARYLNKYTYQIENELKPGLNGCVGIAYSVSDKFEFFIEAEEANTRSFHSKTTSIEKEEIIPWLPSNSIQSYYHFVDSKVINSANQNEILNFPISFGRQSYNFGLKYNF